jgi:hypothetical protein
LIRKIAPSVLAGTIPGPTTRGGHRPDQDLRTKVRGQHEAAPHSDHSAKAGTAFEVVMGHTIIGRHPIYRNENCACGAPVTWQPLGHLGGNLAPVCTNPLCALKAKDWRTSKQAEAKKKEDEMAKSRHEMDQHKWIRKIKY